MIGAWTAEDNEVEGTHGRDAGGYDDEVDLDAVVDKVNTLSGMVRARWVPIVRRKIQNVGIRGASRNVYISPIPDEKRNYGPFRRVSERIHVQTHHDATYM